MSDAFVGLLLLGILVGMFGTLIGAGGGFILVPVLLLLYPKALPETVTAISLGVVFFNATSGSIAYARMGRIDYRSGIIFAIVTVPGAIFGALSTGLVPRHLFNAVFGILMVAACIYLLFRGSYTPDEEQITGRFRMNRKIIERSGVEHRFSYDVRPGIVISAGVGYVSSFLGIGGGIIHVPALNRMLNFPVHIATATSHFILAIMALAGTIVHIVSGSFADGGSFRTIVIGIGAVAGAQAGALLARRIGGGLIIRSLAVALGIAGVRIACMAWQAQ